MAISARLMVIGATWEQEELIRTAKRMGCYVLATDPNPLADGLTVADEARTLDPRDLHGALELARRFEPDGVTADECDYSHFAAVYVATTLGLANDGLAAAQNTTNKSRMRTVCRAGEIEQPRYEVCRTIDEARVAAGVLGMPVCVKPTDNRGAAGVRIVRDEDAVPGAVLQALASAHSREVLLEEFVDGIHITVDGCVAQNGEHLDLAVATKEILPGDRPIITSVRYPADLTRDQLEAVLTTNGRVVEATGITAGLTHAEYILTPEERCVLVEIANRGGGVLTSAVIVPALSGVDPAELLVSNAVGRTCHVVPDMASDTIELGFLSFDPGVIKAVHGLTDALAMEGVLAIRLFAGKGAMLKREPEWGGDRHGAVILRAGDADGIKRLYEDVRQTICIDYE